MPKRASWRALGGAAVLAVAGCASGTTPTPSSCDPLAAVEQPIALGAIVGAGKDASGTLYVADQGGGTGATDRVFVSDGSTLVRKRITGSGSSSTGGGETHSYSYDEGGATHSLVIVTAAGKVTSMTAFDHDVGKGPGGDAGAGATTLTVVDAAALTGLKLRNLPGDVLVEYLADVENGDTLLVTRPKDDWTYEDFRLFYGKKPALSEEHVSSVTRAKDGGSTTIVFTLGSAEATARFPVVYVDMTFQPGPATLDASGKTLALTLHTPAPTSLPGYTFTCLQ